jgi:hypothetical protein
MSTGQTLVLRREQALNGLAENTAWPTASRSEQTLLIFREQMVNDLAENTA